MQASVIVPARDERDGLARSLASLAAQTQAPARNLVVDLGSADGTQDWLRVRWPAVELVRLPRPDTPAASWLDAVLAQIDSEAIAFLMPGDIWPREALAALTAEMQARVDMAAVMLPSERLLRRPDRPP